MTADQFRPNNLATNDHDHLAEMTALATASNANHSEAAVALAEMERVSAASAASAMCNRAADAAALAELEALSTPTQKKSSPAGGDTAYPAPRYGVQAERAIYQSQIDLVDAFRPSPRKRRRGYGCER